MNKGVKKTTEPYPELIQACIRLVQTGEMEAEANGRWLQRVGGGANNALIHAEGGVGSLAVKLCVRDERRRARREYAALELLGRMGLETAPQVILMAEEAGLPYDAVIYRWVEGKPLSSGDGPFPKDAFNKSILDYLACAPIQETGELLLPAWFHWFDCKPYITELRGFLTAPGNWLQAARPDGVEIYRRLETLVKSCERYVTGSRTRPTPAADCLRLCHVDPNLANALWDGDRIIWVDWEYSGWGDPALELSDLRWHASMDDAPPGLSEAVRRIYQPSGDDHGFYDRLDMWDHILVVRWPFLVLRWLASREIGEARQRITRPDADPATLWVRFFRLLERAEAFYQ